MIYKNKNITVECVDKLVTLDDSSDLINIIDNNDLLYEKKLEKLST